MAQDIAPPAVTGPYASRVAEALPSVRAAIRRAAAVSGRPETAVRLVAVTKGHPTEAVRAAVGHGLMDLGENRVEALEARASEFADPRVRWHLIGHVQSRKAKRVEAHLFHAVDSLRVARKLSDAQEARGRVQNVLVQMNVSGEASKGGLSGPEALAELDSVVGLRGVEVVGLMTMAPWTDDRGTIRRTFADLRDVHERALATTAYAGTELSMGMSHDFEIAIEEGSTMVRLGTILFGERPR